MLFSSYFLFTSFQLQKLSKMDKIDNIVRHAEVSEKSIERYLVKVVDSFGGICLKYSNPNVSGYPDRVAIMPNGRTCWFEIKSKGKKPSKLQMVRFSHMARLGHFVYVVDNKEDINEILAYPGYEV